MKNNHKSLFMYFKCNTQRQNTVFELLYVTNNFLLFYMYNYYLRIEKKIINSDNI